MKFDDLEKACQMLIEAVVYDKQILTELEDSGRLHGGYDPKMRSVHEQNAQLLEAFIEHFGWPLPSKFGVEVHRAAWFIAIHAISKPPLLRYALQLLEQALQDGESVAEEYAKLFDRIALYEGRKQCYGTQFFPSPTGWHAWNLVDPEHVDVRRASLGLSTFLEGKEDCGAAQGGIIDAAAKEHSEVTFLIFLKEVSWHS